MTRLRFWRRDDEDALDPEVLSIFASSSQPPALDPARLERGRVLVAARLRPEPAAGGWFGRRFAYGAAGGGGLWASVVGVAAANKAAATAIGVGVLLAGGATAEISGIGPAVREAVSPVHSVEEPVIESTLEPVASAEASVTAGTPEANGNGNGSTVTDGPAGVPGNLMAHVRPDGSLMLRGVLIDATDTQIEVQSSLDDVPIQFELGDATIRIPGGNTQGGPQSETPPTLDEFVGHLVIINGSCETVGDQLTEDCVLETVQVLGNAGQNGASGSSAAPDEPGNSGNPGQGNGPPSEGGRPESPGKPDETPGNGPGGNNRSGDTAGD